MNIWENVKNRLSVDEVISAYIPIQSNGGNYRCVCPFHKEKSPSLIISPQKGIWHCFGCGVGGDIFKFVEEFEHITKSEALQILAKKAGVELEKIERKQISPQQINQQEQGFKYLEFGATTYHKILLKLLQDKDNRITQYCLSRGLTMEIINQFQIGYAPTNNFLLKLGQKHGLDNQILLDIGLLKEVETADVKTDAKNIKDKFTDRLMLPIWDKTGRVIGFTGRSIPPDKVERPKYLNSPQNNWFNKSQIWYGWHLARTHILQEKKAIVVEGNMDVVASFQAGLQYTMASQGTSFTPAQVKMLSTITKTVWLAFDNDEAGKLSSDKFFKLASQNNLSVQKVIIPQNYKDLDEYLKSEFAGVPAANINLETKLYLDYILSAQSANLLSKHAEIQKQTILYILDLASSLDDISKEQYLIKLSNITKLSVASLSSQLEKITKSISNNNFPEEEAVPEISSFVNKSKTEKYQRILVSWQNLIALYLNNYTENKLDVLYKLLKVVLPEDLIDNNIEEYIIRNQNELELITENIKQSQQTSQLWLESISSFIDNNTIIFFQNPELQDYYLKWKQG